MQEKGLTFFDDGNSVEEASSGSVDMEFIAKVFHDIKTPMNTITGLIVLAGMNLDEPDIVAESLDKMSVLSDYIVRQLNEALDISRMQSGQSVLVKEPFSLSALLDRVYDMVLPDAEAKKQTICRHPLAATHDTLTGDEQRLQQVLVNLLENSVKYTPEGGAIEICVTERHTGKEAAEYEFVIRDNGMGIELEFLERLYQPFSRSERVQAANIQGTGLGMAIVHNIIIMMDGEISVDSEPDKGTAVTVRVTLPYGESV